jgi:hypothetical protein
LKSPLVVAIVGNFSGWSPSPPENNVVRQENPKIVISPVIAEAVNTVSFFREFSFIVATQGGFIGGPERAIIYYENQIRACLKVRYQLVYMGKKGFFYVISRLCNHL